MTVSTAYAPSNTAKIGAADSPSAWRHNSTAQAVFVRKLSPAGR